MDANGRVCGSLVRVRVVRVPAREAILGEQSDDQMKEEEKKKTNDERRRNTRRYARDIEINHGESAGENCHPPETTESAVLASVANVEEELREVEESE